MSIIAGIPLVGKLVGTIGNVVNKGREIRKGNVEKREARDAANKASAREQFAQEFIKPTNWFDSLINGMNRLPRPLLALGTIGLFVYAFIDPVGFAATMTSLNLIPPELWYLFGAIVTFYFGVREFSGSRKHKETLAHIEAKAEVAKHVANNTHSADKTSTKHNLNEVPNPALDRIRKVMDEEKRRSK